MPDQSIWNKAIDNLCYVHALDSQPEEAIRAAIVRGRRIEEAARAVVVAYNRASAASATGRLDEWRRYFDALEALEAALA